MPSCGKGGGAQVHARRRAWPGQLSHSQPQTCAIRGGAKGRPWRCGKTGVATPWRPIWPGS
eukprot:11488694-Prorocentrum_lima.AAC.1